MIAFFALAKLAVQLALSSGYGYFRDEFYYLACTEHLDAGYVDHPPLSVFLLWLVRHTIGDSRLALRTVPAVAGAATVGLVGLVARALGASRGAAAVAMTAALIAPEYLGIDHVYSMNAFDVFFWALAAYLVILIVQKSSLPLWVWLGVVLGLGLLNKISVLWLGAGLVAGFLAAPERRLLETRGPWVAAAIAAALSTPYVVWEVRHGWPTIEFMRNATGEKMAHVAPLSFVAGQIEMMHPFTLPLWAGGLVFLLFHRSGRMYRLLALAYLTVFLVLATSGSSRAGYLAPAYTWLFAAGAMAFDQVFGSRRRIAVIAAMTILLAGGIVTAPLALPVLPVDTYIGYARALGQRPSTEERKEVAELGQFFADMHGWDEIVSTVADVYRRLPDDERSSAQILAPDYGIAGAIDLLGRREGLPHAISGHNNYWLWGPRGWDGRVLIVIGGREERLRSGFDRVERAATLECGRCMPYENHRPVWICRGFRMPVDEFWGRMKHYE